MATHCSTLAWRIPQREGPGGLRSMGSHRVRHDWATSLSLFTLMHRRRKWQPTPVFLPGIPGTGEPGGLLSMRSHRVGHDWSDLAAAAATAATRKNRRKKWTQNIPKLKADETRIRKGKWEKGRCSLWCQRIPGRKMFSKQRLDDGVKSFWKGNKWDSACGSI